LLIALSAGALVASAAGPVGAKSPNDSGVAPQSDNIATPLSTRQTALKTAAQQAVLTGQATAKGKNKVVKLAKGQYVELAFQGEDQILTVLGEFGNTIHPVTGGTPGPVHNQIPAPNRATDNTTIWTSDFSQAYYDNLLFNRQQFPSMANFYLEQSSGQYTVDGYVSDWVTVPYNEARYGTNLCGGIVCSTVWSFVNTSADEWWDELVAQQGSVAAANAFLATFDVWDRYDYNGNGNFDEPDGYIDHFQSIHAGEGEEVGGGAQGADAIWSHRSYVNSVPSGDGPTVNGTKVPFGGAKIGNSKYWIGDYTIEPENGGVGVFSHEFGHDLGLPDEYETNGNIGNADNSTGFWTIMSAGSYGSQQPDEGTEPVHFSAWDKFQLGFLDKYVVATSDQSGQFSIGPAEFNTDKAQAAFILLPDKVVHRQTPWPAKAGDFMYFSSNGANLDNTMTRAVHLGSGPINVSFKAKYHIEPCWDYAYLQVSDDDGTTWTNVHTDHSSSENTNNQNFGEGITGVSGSPLQCDNLTPTPEWVTVNANLNAYANKDVLIRFRYWTDGLTNGDGFSFDNLQITGLPKDGGETDPGWEYDGFQRTSGEYDTTHFNAYVIENRQYIGYDYSLTHVPSAGADSVTNPYHVDFFPYQNGLLIWYWDESQPDNNTSEHPGSGLILPVDSHPKINKYANGHQVGPTKNTFDSTFTTRRTQSITIHEGGTGSPLTIPSQPGVSVFDDSQSYWVKKSGSDGAYKAKWNSVIVPNTGTTIRIIYIDEHVAKLQLN
jgi:immune inhibitor A